MSWTRAVKRVQRMFIRVVVHVEMYGRHDVAGHVDDSLQKYTAGEHLRVRANKRTQNQ